MLAAHPSAFAQEKRPSRSFPTSVIFVYFSCVLTVSILLGRTSPRIPEAAPCPPTPAPALGPQRLLPELAKRLGPRWALPRAGKHHSGRDKTPRYQVEEGERSRNTKHRTSLRAFLGAHLSSIQAAGRPAGLQPEGIWSFLGRALTAAVFPRRAVPPQPCPGDGAGPSAMAGLALHLRARSCGPRGNPACPRPVP